MDYIVRPKERTHILQRHRSWFSDDFIGLRVRDEHIDAIKFVWKMKTD